ncbi:MAG: Oligopeptide transport system permease protein [Sporanaerobacter sp.]|jgi:oligopeptide transport system permease protein|uniref:ABC transporter permease n=1 Tax=Sporanaerobacter sp. TaxID=2010183 RepID=UPI003A0FE9F4
MFKFILKRIFYGLFTLFLITTATFFLIAGAPGDPIAAKVGQMPEKAQAVIRTKYGLDKPVVVRYGIYMKNLITKGDFGESIVYTGKSVNDIIKKNAPISAKIGIIALVLQIVIGVLLGLISALHRGKTPDYIIRVLVVLAICVPSFVFAALLQYFIGFKWKLAPVFGWGEMKHYILPVLAYTIGGVASYTKFMRSSTLSVINEDYILTAKSKGCKKGRVIKKHVMRNSMIPIVTMTGPAIAGIFAGSFVIERIFSIPGLGSYYVKSVTNNDYTMILGFTIFFAALYVLSLIFVDIMYGVVDPRIRITSSED